ncbi:unnamed protein product [Cochlearia groenlandica]
MAVNLDSDSDIDIEEEDLEKLESDVKKMAMKISEFRRTLPYNLRNTLDSALSSLRSVSSSAIASGSDPMPSSRISKTGTEEKDLEEKVVQLKEKMLKNAPNLPKLAKRVRECAEKINKLDSSEHGTIHPAFTRRKLNR